jgi:hypothetical protein
LVSVSCNSGAKPEAEDSTISKTGSRPAKIEFVKTAHDFGTLKEGEKVEFSFRYKNTGTEPLSIVSAESDCGCTVLQWVKKPLLENETGNLLVLFETAGFTGNTFKTITVTTNTDSIIELKIGALIQSNLELIENF